MTTGGGKYTPWFSLVTAQKKKSRDSFCTLPKETNSSPDWYRPFPGTFETAPIQFRLPYNPFSAIPAVRLYRTTPNEPPWLCSWLASRSKWLWEWEISSQESTAQEHHGCVRLTRNLNNYEYSLAHVRSLPAGAPGMETAAVALRLPLVFDFDPLFKLDADSPPRSASSPSSASSSPTCSQNSKHGRPATPVPSKHTVRPSHLLMAADADAANPRIRKRAPRAKNPSSDARIPRVQNIEHEPHGLPYAQAAEALQLEPSEIEKWAIDVIRVGLLRETVAESAYYALNGADVRARVVGGARDVAGRMEDGPRGRAGGSRGGKEAGTPYIEGQTQAAV
ncbi:hypothetical protein FB451DRAFT_1392184 [Mycena latifolia]|nr:hypothetical protein FB451DRAFT_1392184 [Mycena latifolia]